MNSPTKVTAPFGARLWFLGSGHPTDPLLIGLILRVLSAVTTLVLRSLLMSIDPTWRCKRVSSYHRASPRRQPQPLCLPCRSRSSEERIPTFLVRRSPVLPP